MGLRKSGSVVNVADFCAVGLCELSGTFFTVSNFCCVGLCFVFSKEEYSSCKIHEDKLNCTGSHRHQNILVIIWIITKCFYQGAFHVDIQRAGSH